MSESERGSSKRDSRRSIVRLIVGAVLVVLLIVAGLDYRAKKQFESTSAAIADKIKFDDGLNAVELSKFIEGNPRRTGDPMEDETVTYTWGLIRSYAAEVTISHSVQLKSDVPRQVTDSQVTAIR